MIKKCIKCQSNRPEDDFYLTGIGTRRGECKFCWRRIAQHRYHTNPAHREIIKEVNRRNRVLVIKVIKWIKNYLPCANCRNIFSNTLQFDHRNPENKKGVVSSKRTSPVCFLKELLKTRPLCPNCHAERTSIQRLFKWKPKGFGT